MKKFKKLSIFAAITGGSILAATPALATACNNSESSKKGEYTITGADSVAVECHNSKISTLGLKDKDGNEISSNISWSFDKTEGNHSTLRISGNIVESCGISNGEDNYKLKGFYNGQEVETTFSVIVGDSFSIEGPESCEVTVDGSTTATFVVKTTGGESITEGVSWTMSTSSNVQIVPEDNKFTITGKVYGNSKHTVTARFDNKTLTFSLTINVKHKYTVIGNDAVIVLVGQTTPWIDFYLRDETGQDVAENDVAWSIYGTGTHAHVQRNSDIYNEFNVTGDAFGEDTLRARAIFNGEFYEFTIPIYVYHYYHVDGLSTVNVTVGKNSNNMKLRLLDETGTEVSDPENVKWYLDPDDKSIKTKDQKYSRITLNNDNTYTITGKEYVPAYELEQHNIYADYGDGTYYAPVRVNVDHTYHVSEECQEVNVKVGEDNASIEGDEWIRMQLLDENDKIAVPKQRLDWSIYGTGTHATFSRDPNSTNGYKVHGKSYGTDKVNARAIFDGTYYEFVITVNVGHKYSIDAKGFSLLLGALESEVEEHTLTLLDENNNAVPNGSNITWTLENTTLPTANQCTELKSFTSSTGKFKIIPKTGVSAGGYDTYKVTAQMSGDTTIYEKEFRVEVHDYAIEGVDPITVNVNGSQLSELKVKDGSGSYITSNIEWSIIDNVTKEHSEAQIIDNKFVNVIGKSFGQDRYDVQVTITTEAGNTEEIVTAPLYVTVGHIYKISGEKSISISTDTESKIKYQLLDETESALSSGAEWFITPKDGNQFSTGTIDKNTGECTINANSTPSGETPDSYEIMAKYNDVEYKMDLSVEVTTIQITDNDNYFAPLGVLFESPKATLKLTKGSGISSETITEGVKWSAVSKTTTPAQTQCCQVVFENPTSGQYTVQALQTGTEVFVISAEYDGVTYTTELSITVFDAGNVYYEIQTDDTTKTCTLYKYLGTTGEGYDSNRLVIPEQIGIYKVTKVGPGSFSGAKDFSNIDFSKARYLETIGQAAFSNCKLNASKFNTNRNGLEEYSLDFSKTSLVSVEKDAFLHAIGNENTNTAAASFKYLKFPTTIRSIGETAFGEETGIGPVVTWWIIELEDYKEYSEPWFNQIVFTSSNDTDIAALSLDALWTWHRNNYYGIGLKILVPSSKVSNYKNVTNIGVGQWSKDDVVGQ